MENPTPYSPFPSPIFWQHKPPRVGEPGVKGEWKRKKEKRKKEEGVGWMEEDY